MVYYIITPVIVFVAGYLILRFLGKKAVSEMNNFDILVVIILGTVMATPAGSSKPWVAIYHSIIIAIVYYIFSKLSIQNGLKGILTSKPTLLVQNGDIDEAGLRKVRLSVDMLMGILRTKGYSDVNEMELVMMEQNGEISAIPMATKRPIQPNDIQLNPSPTFIPIPLIVDGEIIEANLQYLKKNHSWLIEQMRTHNLTNADLSSITLAIYNQQGYVNFDLARKE